MRCAKCGTKLRGGGYPSPLGERVCQSCHTTIAGAAIGVMGAGGFGAPGALPGAIAGPGILRWISETLHPSKRRARIAAEAEAAATPGERDG